MQRAAIECIASVSISFHFDCTRIDISFHFDVRAGRFNFHNLLFSLATRETERSERRCKCQHPSGQSTL